MKDQHNPSSFTPKPLRVLVVDNIMVDRVDHEEALKEWGYEPISAEGSGWMLIEDAKNKARIHRCHAAIIDIRLFDDRDISDRSGLELVPYLKPAKCIVVTGYGKAPESRIANAHGASMIGKEEGPEALQNELNRVLADLLRNDFRIAPEHWIETHVLSNLKSDGNEAVVLDEVQDLLEILFPDINHLKLDHLSQGLPSPTDLTSGLRRNSMVVRCYISGLVPFIIKFAAPSRIRRERTNYETHIKDRLPGRRYAQLSRHKCLWNVGAIAYAFLGEDDADGDISLFRTLYRAHDAEDIQHCLQDFFMTVWAPNYDHRSELNNSLFAAYDRLWAREQSTTSPTNEPPAGPLGAKLGVWRYKDQSRTARQLGIELPDPRRWIAEHHHDSALPSTKQTIIHGDFHGDNLFVDVHLQTWVIDFERTGPGHILADFVRMEHDILNRLAKIDDLRTYCKVVVAITTPRSPTTTIPLQPCEEIDSEKNEISKALDVIRGLRQFSQELFRYSDQREYYWGLLLDVLFSIQRFEKLLEGLSKSSNDRSAMVSNLDKALLLGGVLCRRLQDWGDPWPPADWQPLFSPDSQIATQERSKPQLTKILFLAANPSGAVQLNLGREARSIREALRKAEARDRFAFAHEPAIRINDLIDHLLEHKPTIVHFSGHGSEAGEIIVEDDRGLAVSLPQESIQRIFAQFTDGNDAIRCVILNACFAEAQARLIAEHVDIVIGITSEIRDDVATRFATTFYSAIGAKTNVHKAFALACESINLNRLKPPDAIHLITRSGVDPHAYLLA